MAAKLRIAITTGDPNGIGPEVTSKALLKVGPLKDIQWIIYRSESSDTYFSGWTPRFSSARVDHWDSKIAFDTDIVEVISGRPAPFWVEEVAQNCLIGELDGLVTGPLSKTLIKEVFPDDLGHTEILGRVAQCSNLFMSFIGEKFNVLLATGHRPLKSVPETLTRDLLKMALDSAFELRSLLPAPKNSLPIGLLGLNPHAGEQGHIGSEESLFEQLLNEFAFVESVEGPLVPDAAFLPKFWNQYSVYLCLYHDQGLIPFKLVHQQESGYQVTMGLPFVRTSVDHGTAKEIFGQNKADERSMVDALKGAVNLIQRKRKLS